MLWTLSIGEGRVSAAPHIISRYRLRHLVREMAESVFAADRVHCAAELYTRCIRAWFVPPGNIVHVIVVPSVTACHSEWWTCANNNERKAQVGRVRDTTLPLSSSKMSTRLKDVMVLP
jgi:hypothetical protein